VDHIVRQLPVVLTPAPPRLHEDPAMRPDWTGD
jgi:hypothetical protein